VTQLKEFIRSQVSRYEVSYDPLLKSLETTKFGMFVGDESEIKIDRFRIKCGIRFKQRFRDQINNAKMN